MHAVVTRAVPVVLLAVGFAGCLGGADPLDAVDGALGAGVPRTAWQMDFTNCEEGGFIASSFQAGEPWVRRNIRPEIGPDHLAAVERTGNWHNGIRCEEATYDGQLVKNFQFGWVGVGIEPPAWDPGGADRHFVLAGLGLPDTPMRDGMLATINADISRTIGSYVTWLYGDVIEVEYADQDKGTYGGRGLISLYRDSIPDRTTRFWWVVPANGERILHDHHGGEMRPVVEGGFHPVYWDMTTASGPQWSSPYDRVAWTTHTGTADHGDSEVDTNWGEVNSMVVYQYPSLSLSYGGIVRDVTLETEWVH